MSYFDGKIGKPRELAVLIDVDGVIANFVDKISSYLENRFEIVIDRSKIYSDVKKEAKGFWDEECDDFIRQPGFAQSLDEIPGAVNAVKQIMEASDGKVLFVTSPYDSSPTWCYDRYMWLKDRFEISRDDVIFARDKRFISGLTLIDDRWENVVDWSIFNKRISVLKKTSQNLNALTESVGYHEGQYFQEIMVPHYPKGQQANILAIEEWSKIVEYMRLFLVKK